MILARRERSIGRAVVSQELQYQVRDGTMTERQPILTPELHLSGLVSPLDLFAGSATQYPRESNIVALFESAAE